VNSTPSPVVPDDKDKSVSHQSSKPRHSRRSTSHTHEVGKEHHVKNPEPSAVPTRPSKGASSGDDQVMRVAICGYKRSGKSSLLQRLNGDELYPQDPSASGSQEEEVGLIFLIVVPSNMSLYISYVVITYRYNY
jgi:hypothetical protein